MNVMLKRAKEEGSGGEEEVREARELVQRHGEGYPHSGNLSQGSCSLSGCMKETWTRPESRPGHRIPYTGIRHLDNAQIVKYQSQNEAGFMCKVYNFPCVTLLSLHSLHWCTTLCLTLLTWQQHYCLLGCSQRLQQCDFDEYT